MRMKEKFKKLLLLLVVTIIGIGITSAVSLTSSTKINEQSTSTQSTDVITFDKLSGEWWQWAMSVPVSVNPINDSSGEDCMVGQSGPIWFLGGVFGGGSATRKCSIPADKKLFFPVINSVNVNTPNVCGQGPNDMSVQELRDQIAPFIDHAVQLSALVDNQPQTITRLKSEVFSVALPEDNIFDTPCKSFGNVPAGVYSPGIADGFYVTLDPLSPGQHTLNIHAKSGKFVLEVNYDLNVTSVKLS